jgi:murein endopeptidase
VDVRASALAVLSFVGVDATPVQSLVLEIEEPPVQPMLRQVIPYAELPQINLDAVWWTAPRNESLALLAERWGTKEKALRKLNPEVRGDRVEAGQRFVIYRHQPGTVSRSVGAPNRGRLEHGVPFLEGDYWQLRSYRPRSYATRDVVVNLATALERWGVSHREASPVKIGEFSKRGGGRLKPHSSHRTGRDVDIGYVVYEPAKGSRFKRATKKNLDAEATWDLVHSLIATGGIDHIFMNAYIQRMLLPHAERELPPEELRRWFSVAARGKGEPMIKHWRGHDDHMHVRFACTPLDLRCREAKKRRRR